MPRSAPATRRPPRCGRVGRWHRPSRRRPARRGGPTFAHAAPGPDRPAPGARRSTTCPSWSPSRCGSRPTRRSWSPARCGWCCRCTTSRTRSTSATPPLLWAESGPEASHGFGDRARTHATIALRGAADAWPVLDRLLELRVPDEITLDTDELVEPARRRGGRPRASAGVDVLWPRSLGPRPDRDAPCSTGRPRSAPREEPLQPGLLRPGRAVRLQLADRAARRPADRGGDGPARRRRRRRCSSCATTGRSSTRRSPGRRASGWSARSRPAQARGCGADRRRRGRTATSLRGAGRRRRHACSRSASGCARAATREPVEPPGRAGRHAARLPAPRPDLAGRADRARPRRLPGRRHGPRQDRHPDRAAPAPSRAAGRTHRAARPSWSARPPCSATGRRRSERFAPGDAGPPLPRRPAASLGRASTGGFVLTTYGTMRSDRADGARPTVAAGTWSSPTRPSTSRTPRSADRPRPAHDPERRPGWR